MCRCLPARKLFEIADPDSDPNANTNTKSNANTSAVTKSNADTDADSCSDARVRARSERELGPKPSNIRRITSFLEALTPWDLLVLTKVITDSVTKAGTNEQEPMEETSE